MKPVGLNQPRLMANTSTRPSAIRKFGIAKPSTEITWTTLSTQPPRTAAHTPEQHGDDRDDDHCAEHDRHRHGGPRRDGVDDRLTGEPRIAEITGDGALQPVDVLGQDRLIHAELLRLGIDRLLVAVWPRMLRAMSPAPRYMRKNASDVAANNRITPAAGA